MTDLLMNNSEVALVLSNTAFNSLKREIRAIVNPIVKKELLQFFSDAEMFKGKSTGEVLFYWHEVAWLGEKFGNNSIDSVVFIENVLSYLSDNDYHFIRLGVDDNDIEDDGYYPDSFDCYVVKELCIRREAGKRITIKALA